MGVPFISGGRMHRFSIEQRQFLSPIVAPFVHRKFCAGHQKLSR
jgi:hypothetical protein